MALTARQSKFIDEYMVDLNATQAAIRAGYSAKTAGQIGDENLKKPEIQKFLSVRIKDREKRTELTQDKVLGDIERIKVDAMQKVYDKDGNEVMLNHGAALKAAELQGRHLALFNDKLNVNHTFAELSDADLEAEIETLKAQLGKT